MSETKQISFFVDKNIHTVIKEFSHNSDVEIQEIYNMAIKSWVKNNKEGISDKIFNPKIKLILYKIK